MVGRKGRSGGRNQSQHSVRALRRERAAKGNGAIRDHPGNGSAAPMPPGLSPAAALIWHDAMQRYPGCDPALLLTYVNASVAAQMFAGATDPGGYRRWFQSAELARRLGSQLQAEAARPKPAAPAAPEQPDLLEQLLQAIEQERAAATLFRVPWPVSVPASEEEARAIWAGMSPEDQRIWLKEARKWHGHAVDAPKMN